jgi:hypothetical protein
MRLARKYWLVIGAAAGGVVGGAVGYIKSCAGVT